MAVTGPSKRRFIGQLQEPGLPPRNVALVLDSYKREYESVTVTATAYTVLDKLYILVDDDTAGGDVTITLPANIDNTDKTMFVKKLGTTGNVILTPAGSETIDGDTTATIILQYTTLCIASDGTNWQII